MNRVALPVVTLLGLLVATVAGEEVRIRTVGTEPPRSARLLKLSSDAAVVEIEQRQERIPRSRLWWMEFQSPATDEMATGQPWHLIEFTNGDRLYATVVGADELTLTCLRNGLTEPIEIPLEFVDFVVFDTVSEPSLAALLRRIPLPGDLAILENRDRVSGEFAGMAPETITFTTSLGETSLERATVAALAFGDELKSRPDPAEHPWFVTLADGSRLTVTSLETTDVPEDQDQWQAVLRVTETPLPLPHSAIARCDFTGESVRPLDPAAADDVEYTPYLFDPVAGFELPADGLSARTEPQRMHRQGDVRPAGMVLPYGFGVRTRTRATFSVQPGATHFSTLVGIDAGSAGGVAVVTILLDENEAFTASIASNTPPIEVGPIPLKGATRLTLVADYGPGGDVQDLVNWGLPAYLVLP